MATKLNNKGYVLVEIILASAIAFGLAFYMTSLTIKLKNKNDDILAETLAMTDQTIIQNKLVQYMDSEGKDFNCDGVSIDNESKVIAYNNEIVDILNDYVTVDLDNYSCVFSNGYFKVFIPLRIEAINKNYNVDLYYIPSANRLSQLMAKFFVYTNTSISSCSSVQCAIEYLDNYI